MAAVAPRKSGSNHGTYSFSSQPRTVPQRKKYREMIQPQEEPTPYGNIMYDRRIVRGSTYAQSTLPISAQPDPIEIQRQQEVRRRAAARRRARQHLKPRSPEPVEGRKHIDVQTELYLEELSDRVEEAEADTQTDAFLDRPPTPLFVPAKTGVDVATQIADGDLFDFDIEVKPILEVLVGKTMEQALLEVMEEEELAALRQRQREFEQIRHAELVETQRLEEQDRRHRGEKERRMAQERKRVIDEKETMDKIAARTFAQSYLEDLVPSVFNTLDMHGYFYDQVEREVETSFVPWLAGKVNGALSQTALARAVLDDVVRDVVKKRARAYKGHQPDIWGDVERDTKEEEVRRVKEEEVAKEEVKQEVPVVKDEAKEVDQVKKEGKVKEEIKEEHKEEVKEDGKEEAKEAEKVEKEEEVKEEAQKGKDEVKEDEKEDIKENAEEDVKEEPVKEAEATEKEETEKVEEAVPDEVKEDEGDNQVKEAVKEEVKEEGEGDKEAVAEGEIEKTEAVAEEKEKEQEEVKVKVEDDESEDLEDQAEKKEVEVEEKAEDKEKTEKTETDEIQADDGSD